MKAGERFDRTGAFWDEEPLARFRCDTEDEIVVTQDGSITVVALESKALGPRQCLAIRIFSNMKCPDGADELRQFLAVAFNAAMDEAFKRMNLGD